MLSTANSHCCLCCTSGEAEQYVPNVFVSSFLPNFRNEWMKKWFQIFELSAGHLRSSKHGEPSIALLYKSGVLTRLFSFCVTQSARSPDLILILWINYCVWGYLKERVFLSRWIVDQLTTIINKNLIKYLVLISTYSGTFLLTIIRK